MRRLLTEHLGISLGSILAILVLGACPDRSISSLTPKQAKVEPKVVPVQLNREIDILFLIDNSLSMKEEQAQLSANFPKFIRVLNSIDGGLPDVRIGVATSNVGAGQYGEDACADDGDSGQLHVKNCAGLSGDRPFIEDLSDGEGRPRKKNYEGELAAAFSCIADVGDQGCGLEQHLEAMKRVLQANPGGFLRPNAFLAVVFIADEDDCSASDDELFNPANVALDSPLGPLTSFRCFEFGVKCLEDGSPLKERADGRRTECKPDDNSKYVAKIQQYVDFLRKLKDDPKKVIVAGIIGDPKPVAVGPDPKDNNNPSLLESCSSRNGTADPAIRLRTFIESFPDRGTVTTICQDDLSDGLTLIAELLKKAIGNPCIEGDLAEPLQCTVEDVTNPGAKGEKRTLVPPCDDGGSGTCWKMIKDEVQCPSTESQLRVDVQRTGVPPPNTFLHIQCVVN